MHINLLPRFSEIIRVTAKIEAKDAARDHPLLLGTAKVGSKSIQMFYAPFDNVTPNARIAIVGLTPGEFQANNALSAARAALAQGLPAEEAGRLAKIHASFSGEPMRSNLIQMMDRIGLPRVLGIGSTASLWAADSKLVQFTSALRYPVFIDGANWSGTPDMVRTAALREWLLAYTGAELAALPDAVIVPLGPKVSAAMYHLADQGLIDRNKIMDGLPHPSGANAERIAYFLGRKLADDCSSKTNPARLDDAREALIAKAARLSPIPTKA